MLNLITTVVKTVGFRANINNADPCYICPIHILTPKINRLYESGNFCLRRLKKVVWPVFHLMLLKIIRTTGYSTKTGPKPKLLSRSKDVIITHWTLLSTVWHPTGSTSPTFKVKKVPMEYLPTMLERLFWFLISSF